MRGNYEKENGKKTLIILIAVAVLVLVVVIGLIIGLSKKPEEKDPLSTKGTTDAAQGQDGTEGSVPTESENTEPFVDFPTEGSGELPIEIIDNSGGNTGSGNTGSGNNGGGNTGNTGGDTTGGDNTGSTGNGGTDLEVDFSELIGKK